MEIRKHVFSATVGAISRVLAARDLLLGRIGPLRALRGKPAHGFAGHCPDAVVTRCSIASGRNTLDAYFVRPTVCEEGDEVRAVVLICHGIGETVAHWLPVQRLFAAQGVASLVFDYSGYGWSSGWVTAANCERDAVAAFAFLQRMMPGYAVALLGYSLGSGVAAAVIGRVEASRLILCAAFTSFRAAARSLGFPRFLTLTLPHMWQAEVNLRGHSSRVLIVHGERDQLFPVAMAEELASYCESELVLVPGMTHNEPFYTPDIAYWGLILSRLTAKNEREEKPVDLVMEMPGDCSRTGRTADSL
jgi:pimeloyl-ACP methyl ester carboxylesterase